MGKALQAAEAAAATQMELLRGYYDALGRRDVDAAVACLAPDVVFEVGTGTYEGHAAVKRWLTEMGGAWSEFSMEVERCVAAGHHAVVLLRFRARGRVSGAELSQRPAHVWSFSAGKPARMVSYADRAKAAAVAGVEPDAVGTRR